MSEDRTRKLPNSQSFEERVLSQLSAINTRFDTVDARLDRIETRISAVEGHVEQIDKRLTALEDKVDRRLQETRPIWEGVQAQLANIEIKVEAMNEKMDTLAIDMFELRSDQRTLQKRVTRMEGVQPPR